MHTSDHIKLVVTSIQGRYLYVNQHFKKVFLRKNEEIAGKIFIDTVHPEDQKKCIEAAERCMRKPNHQETLTIRKPLPDQKKFVTSSWEFSLLKTPETGEPLGIVCVGVDVSDFISSVELLNSRERQLKLLSEQHTRNIRAPLASLLGLIKLIDKSAEEGKVIDQELIQLLNAASRNLENILKNT